MKEHIFKKLLERYSNHESDEDERLLVERWYNSFDQDKEEIDQLKDRRSKRELRNTILFGIHTKIDAPKDKPNTHGFTYLKIAASILLVGGLGSWLWNNYAGFKVKPKTQVLAYVSTGSSRMKKLILPDSSEVWLNSASTLHYPKDFNHTKERQVSLDQGEAFFKVKHNANRPFIVQAGGLSTQVLGTSFNIRSYRELDEIRITVLTGKVKVSKWNRLLDLLEPGQQIVYHKETDQNVKLTINPSESNSWINGKTYLSQASFTDLAFTLKNRYGIVLKTEDAKIRKLQFSLQLDQKTPIEYTIKAICSIHQTKYRRREGNEIELY